MPDKTIKKIDLAKTERELRSFNISELRGVLSKTPKKKKAARAIAHHFMGVRLTEHAHEMMSNKRKKINRRRSELVKESRKINRRRA